MFRIPRLFWGACFFVAVAGLAYMAGSRNLALPGQAPSVATPASAQTADRDDNIFASGSDSAQEGQTQRGGLASSLSQSRRTALVTASARASGSVVSIGAERPALVRQPMPGFWADPFFGSIPFYQRIRQKVPFLGSGITLDRQGHIVTNYHVIEGAERLFVTLADKKEYEAQLVGFDKINDIAFLKVDADSLQPAPLGDSDQVLLGEWVLAIGNPYGTVIEDPTPTITAGVVSARNRYFHANTGSSPRLYEGMIQTDAAINPGNSGGALVNALGEVIGMNTFILSESGGSIGIGFAIPINKIKRMMRDIRQYGRLRKGRIDFVPISLNAAIRAQLGLNVASGLLVYQMERGGPAEQAGIDLGDVIVAVDGQPVGNREDFMARVFGAPVGTVLRFRVLREGKEFEAVYQVQEEAAEADPAR